MISEVLNRIIRFVFAIFSVLFVLGAVFPSSLDKLDEDISIQINRIAVDLSEAVQKAVTDTV